MPPAPPPPVMLHDVTVVRKKTVGRAKIAAVPPEEFGVSRRAHSIAIQTSTYCFHAKQETERDLIELGYDRDQVESLPADDSFVQGSESQKRDTVHESSEGNSLGMNAPNRVHRVVEHYCWLDYEEDGKARRYKVVTGGGSGANEILKRDGKPVIEEVEQWPFATMTPVIISHRFFGRSIADLTTDIQEIKTALLRGVLDNTYLLNNQRIEVSESHIVDQTLDDLLSNRPGGIVRTKQPGGLLPIPNAPIGDAVMGMIGYMDSVREGRTGVSRQATGLDANALQKINVGENALMQMNSAAQGRMKLIARIFAETGVRDLFLLLHAIVRQNATSEDTVKLRGKWTTVNPRDWIERRDMTVSVGLGHGDKPQQLAFMNGVLQLQEKAIAHPEMGLCKPANIYNALKKMLVLGGERAVDQYFTDPDATGPDGQPLNQPQPPSDPKTMEIQGKIQVAQASAQADLQKTQADIEATKQTTQMKLALMQAETQAKLQLMQKEFELTLAEKQHEAVSRVQADDAAAQAKAQPAGPDNRSIIEQRKLALEEAKAEHDAAIKDRELRLKEAEHNRHLLTENGGVSTPLEASLAQVGQAIGSLAEQHKQHGTEYRGHMERLASLVAAPKRVVRGHDNKVVGVVTEAQDAGPPQVPHEPVQPPTPVEVGVNQIGQAIGHLARQHAESHAEHKRHMEHIAALMTAPKRVVRGPDGKVSHVEVVS